MTPIPSNRATFLIEEMATITGGHLHGDPRVATTVGITTDSRAVTPGCAFVALRGLHHDGHAYVEAAGRAGCALALVEEGEVPGGVARLVVRDTLVALGDLARAHARRWRTAKPERRLAAITGSSGKTTTKELAAALLRVHGTTHATVGNLNNRVGVPATLLALTDARFCVIELGMSLPGEMTLLASMAEPDISLVTNIGLAHAEGVGGIEGVEREKSAVYRCLGRDGVAVVNIDDPRAMRGAESARGRVVTFGTNADYQLLARRASPEGALLTVGAYGRRLEFRFPLAGPAAATDCLAALALAEAASGTAFDGPTAEVALAVTRLDGRATVHRWGDVIVIDDSYNANPSSMRAALATLSELGADRRKIAVLGEMKELGSASDAEHDALGDAVREAGVSLLIGCGGAIDRTLSRAASPRCTVVSAPSAERASENVLEHIRPGDVVLVKASRSVGAERVVHALEKFSKSLPLFAETASSKP